VTRGCVTSNRAAPDPVAITNAHLIVGQAVDCEVLAELPKGEVASVELILPIMIRGDLIDKDGPVLAAVPRQITLTIAVDVEPPHHTPAFHRAFQIAVWTVLPCQTMSRGRPTLTESNRAIASLYTGTVVAGERRGNFRQSHRKPASKRSGQVRSDRSG
jgi:hypothetical protein